MVERRLERLRGLLQERGLNAMALIPGPSLRYLSGVSFHLMERPIIGLFPAGGPPGLVLPAFELSKAGTSALDFDCFTYSEDPASYSRAVGEAAEALGLLSAHIGVEPLGMRFQEASLIQEALPQGQLVEAGEVTVALRIRKDPREVEVMRRAVQAAEAAIQATIPKIAPGQTEQQIAGELTVQLLRAGSESELPFSPIVASGPNSALPHAGASDRRLQEGDLLLIDWGARIEGYCSDLTRMFALGDVDQELIHIHGVVKQANEAARQAVVAASSAGEVDRAARRVIEEAGYGDQFLHRTGHGIGLEAHEAPYIRGDNDEPLGEGMAFTIEPGVYLEGRGGVRIEDNVVVTGSGVETLSSRSRDLDILP